MIEETPKPEDLEEKSAYTTEEALHLARLWEAGKLIGGDAFGVVSALLSIIEKSSQR